MVLQADSANFFKIAKPVSFGCPNGFKVSHARTPKSAALSARKERNRNQERTLKKNITFYQICRLEHSRLVGRFECKDMCTHRSPDYSKLNKSRFIYNFWSCEVLPYQIHSSALDFCFTISIWRSKSFLLHSWTLLSSPNFVRCEYQNSRRLSSLKLLSKKHFHLSFQNFLRNANRKVQTTKDKN